MSERAADPLAPAPQAILIADERVKLSATYVNGFAIAIAAIGGLTPLIAAVLPKSSDGGLRAFPWAIVGIALFCLGTSVVLQGAARRILGELRL